MLSSFYLVKRRIVNWVLGKSLRDASFHPNRKINIIKKHSPVQINIPQLILDSDKHTFQINFGDQRKFLGCPIRIHYKNEWFSSIPNLNSTQEKPLQFLSEIRILQKTALGSAEKITWQWRLEEDLIIETSFFIFSQQNYLQFQISFPKGINQISTAQFDQPSIIFPSFKNVSLNTRIFTFEDKQFAKPAREINLYTNAPLCFFDDAKNTVLISALNDFATNIIAQNNNRKNINKNQSEIQYDLGPDGLINEIPEGYTINYLMIFDHGINRIFNAWGDLLHQYYGITPRRKDPYGHLMNSHIGYFTDNGGYYYYHPIAGTTYDETFQQIENHYTTIEPLAFQYYHLDSWWYPKSVATNKISTFFGKLSGGGKMGGCIKWEPLDSAWGIPLEELSIRLHNKKFTAHGRWWDENCVYDSEFPMIHENGWAMPTDFEFWEKIMALAKKYHIIIYEQDWMENQYMHFTHLRSEVGAHRLWLEHMATAAEKQGIGIQYCMATPAQWMEAIKFPAVMNVRSTRDYHHNFDWQNYFPHFTQNAILASALGFWPFLDVFYTTKHNDSIDDELWVEPKIMLSALGGGPIAPGDPIGKVDTKLLKIAIRNDGLIYKPDRPLTAADIVFIPHETCYIATTESSHNGLRWHYVLNLDLWPKERKKDCYLLSDLDLEGEFIELNWKTGDIRSITSSTNICPDFTILDYDYRIYAPILPNGMAICGDPSKVVSMNTKQFHNLSWTQQSLSMDLENIANETTTIVLFSPQSPKKVRLNGTDIIDFSYNDKLMHLKVIFEQSGIQNLSIEI